VGPGCWRVVPAEERQVTMMMQFRRLAAMFGVRDGLRPMTGDRLCSE